jgi:hypothetical protein
MSYPSWIYQSIVEDDLPWDKIDRVDFNYFSERYTLHDSHWIGIFYDIGYEDSATLAILWDEFWLPPAIKERISPNSDRTFLFIRLTGVSEISTSNFKDDYGLMQRCITGASIESIEGNHFLGIDDVIGGNVNIIFTGKVKFLAIGSDKQILNI